MSQSVIARQRLSLRWGRGNRQGDANRAPDSRAYEPEAPLNPLEDFPHLRIGSSRLRNSVDYHTREHDLEPGYVPDDEQPVPSSPPVRYSPPATSHQCRRNRNTMQASSALLWRDGAISRGSEHPRRRGGDDKLAVVHDHRALPTPLPYGIEATDPDQPRDAVGATQILWSPCAEAKPRAQLRYRLLPVDLYVKHTSPVVNRILGLALPWLEPNR